MLSFSQTVRDRAGNVIGDALVTVYLTGTTTKPPVFSNAEGTDPLPNPLTSGSNGRITFYVDPGTYDFVVTKGNFSNTISGVQVDSLLASELEANSGALLVGTDNGDNLQVRIDGIESDVADLETDFSNAQPLDPTLTALAAVTTAADKLIYATGADTFTTTDLTSAGRNLLDDADASAMRTTLGLVIGTNVQAQDAELQAIAGLTSAADRVPYFTGPGTASLATLTSAGRDILDDADAAAQRATLGLVIGTNVQAYDANLAAIAGLTSAANKGIEFTGSGTAATYDLTTAGKNLLDDADAAAQRVTLGATTVGGNIFTLANPSAITFPKINADNTVTAESAATHRTSIGATTAGSNLLTVPDPSAVTFPRVNADNTVTMRTAAELASDIGAGASGLTVKRKAANTTRTSTTAYAADPDLQFAMLANTSYSIRIVAFFSSGTTPDLKLDLDGPASPTLLYFQASRYLLSSATLLTTTQYSAYNVSNPVAMSGAPDYLAYIVTGVVQNGANAGTFSLRWAQNVSDPGNTICLAGSFLEYS